jgi:hypothetical protein
MGRPPQGGLSFTLRQMRWALALLVVLVTTGCMSDSSSGTSRDELATLVLQQSDLTPVFALFDEGRQVRADLPTGARADPTRFGRVEGWKARYRRSGTPQTSGPLVVESRVDLFDSSGGAADELDAFKLEQEAAEGTRLLEAPALGDEVFVATLTQPGASSRVRFYLVAWREGDVAASLSVNGFDGKLTLEQALELARKQQRRIQGSG